MSAESIPPGSAAIPAKVAVPAPGQPEPLADEPPGSRWLLVPGFLVLVGCLEVGRWLKEALGLVLPDNILGLFLLLFLLAVGAIPLRWVEGVARLLLFLLPFLFLPVFILAVSNRTMWATQGEALAGAVILGTVLLWAFVGRGSQWLLRRAEARQEPPTARKEAA